METMQGEMSDWVNKIKMLSPYTLPKEENEKLEKVVEATSKVKPEAALTADDWFLKGYIAQIKSNFEDACYYYAKAIELKLDFAEAYNNLGLALFDLAQLKSDELLYRDSISKYENAIKQRPDYVAAYYNLGLVLTKWADFNGHFEQFSADIERVFLVANRLDATYGCLNLACLYARLNEKDKALAWLEKDIKCGLRSRDEIEKDLDFDNIRNDQDFKSLLDKYYSICRKVTKNY